MRECKDKIMSAKGKGGSGEGLDQQTPKRCVAVVEEPFFTDSPSRLPLLDVEKDNGNLPYEDHFVIGAFVHSSREPSGGRGVSVQVTRSIVSKVPCPAR